MKRFLIRIYVLQEVSNAERRINGLPKLGRGFTTAYRLNKWNPLSYVGVLLLFSVGLLAYGFVGIFRFAEIRNPFKWD
jgi:hypothetical protein